MKNTLLIFLVIIVCFPGASPAELFNNPGTNVGKKNLVVGISYSYAMHDYALDTDKLPTSSKRIMLKVTTGLTDWLDIYIKGGGTNLQLDYMENDSNAIKNFDSDYKVGFGMGARIRLLNFPDSQTRVFLQGGGFYFKTDDSIEWEYIDRTLIKNRDMKWADYYAGLGIVKRVDFMDITCGVGFSEIQWWMRDTYEIHQGNSITWDRKDWRDSYEVKNPLFGFFGIDFILPYEYRISAQAGIRDLDNAEVSIALTQGLERR